MTTHVLITGVSGFAGRYLADHAHRRGFLIYGVSRRPAVSEHVIMLRGDLTAPDLAIQAVRASAPDYVFHLAAQTPANSPESSDHDWLLNNSVSTLNLLEALRLHRPQARVLVVSSSAVYGHVPQTELPIREESPLHPTTMYGVSKATQELLAIRYATEHGMHIVRARPFNLIGLGEPRLMLTSVLAAQVAEIADGRAAPVVRMRHRATQRDFTDIRDAIRAYWALLEFGAPGEVYNVCSGVATPIGELVERLVTVAHVSARIEETEAAPAAGDIVVQIGNNARIASVAGWRPQIDLNASLAELLRSFRM